MFNKEPENTNVAGGQTSIIAQGCKFDGKVEVRDINEGTTDIAHVAPADHENVFRDLTA